MRFTSLSSTLSFTALACLLAAPCVTAQADGSPDWLGGAADVEIKAARCAVYEWFFDRANGQTEGVVSDNDLASKRVINLANKLVDHHRSAPSEGYSAEIRYLLFGERGPFHFEFHLSHAALERLLARRCDD